MMRLLFVFFAFLSAVTISAQEWTIDTTVIRIGEPIIVEFSANVDADSRSFPNYDVWWEKGFELMEMDSSISLQKNGSYLMKQKLWITSFDTGFAVLEPVYFQINEQEYSSEPIMVEVQWVMIEEGVELFDIKNIVSIPRPWYFYMFWILGILALVIASYFLWVYFKKRSEYTPAVIIPEKTPAEVALEKIHSLRNSNLWEEEKYGLFFLELTTIFRQYLDRTYSLKVMEATLSELKRAVDGLPTQEMNLREIHDFFEHAEMVKYAKVLPYRTNAEAYLAQVEKFVEILEPRTNTDSAHV